MSSNDWRDRAACNDHPGPFRADAGPATDLAKAICARCSVNAECLELAMSTEGAAPPSGRSGVYGGLDTHQRYQLNKQRAKAASAA